ncbi:MAG: glycosyltransferase family 4 protein [Vicinamibacteria bacterium]
MSQVRVVACCGGMVMVYGMERMTFDVLGVLRQKGAEVHCILNRWENHRIRELVEAIGASWSTGYYWYRFDRHTRNPLKIIQLCWDIVNTSLGLLRDCKRFRATHILVPDHVSVLRNAPALIVLRCLGKPVFLRLANAPERGRFYDFLWGRILPHLVTRMVANSKFALERCLEVKVAQRKLTLIRNRVSRRPVDSDCGNSLIELVKRRKTLLCVGQIAPFKGTHLAVEAALALLEKGAEIQLVVVGAEPIWPPELVTYLQGLRSRVEELNDCDRVHFAGARNDVLELMRESYLFVAPILGEESFGNVVLEAKSVGLPVVAFPRGGIPELVEHERTGYLCKSLDVEGLLEGIEFFLADTEAWSRARRECEAFFRELGNPYSSRAFIQAWQDLFSNGGSNA